MTTQDDRSHRSVLRIRFVESTDMGEVEDTLLLAILAVGCLHGQAAVRLEAGYAIDPESRVVVLDNEGTLAVAVARMFVGMCSHEFGDHAFHVIRRAGALPQEVSSGT
jgi:hypothetical protein